MTINTFLKEAKEVNNFYEEKARKDFISFQVFVIKITKF